MKIIFSRKGFDSSYGGHPSPILPDGRILSLPIPDFRAGVKYGDLSCDFAANYEALLRSLIGHRLHLEGYEKLPVETTGCHIDPDIDPATLPRKVGWRGILGQAGAAQSHLANQGVGVGDIFLFFGWFRHSVMRDNSLIYSPNDTAGSHVLYGFLEVEQVIHPSSSQVMPWMQYHQHVTEQKFTSLPNNTLYIGREHSTLIDNTRGYGVFQYDETLRLTKMGHTRSRWSLPEPFRKVNISYHSPKSWKKDYFQSAMKGQEFVVTCDDLIFDWTKTVLQKGLRISK